jgi:hypothetical protein
MLAFPGVIDDVVRGNINVFLALAVVLTLRHAAAALWSTSFLTKVTPGIGVVWHAGRREWRQFAVALAVTGGIIGIGLLVNRDLWLSWFASLQVGAESYRTVNFLAPLVVRVAAGLAICFIAAFSGRAWLLPVGMLVALPGLWPASFALLTASVVLFKDGPLAVRPLAPATQPKQHSAGTNWLGGNR